MSKMLKKFVAITLGMLIIASSVSVSAEKMVTLYTETGKTKAFPESKVAAQLTVGWYKEPVQRLYAEGKSKVFPQSKVEAQLTVGWYKEPVQRLYAEGKSKVFPQSKVEAQLKVGWYKEPVQRLYAANKSKVFPQSKVAAQLTVGWYKEPLAKAEDVLEITGRKYWLEMPEKELGTADETFKSMRGLTWKVYGTKTYDNFFAAEIQDGKVVTLTSFGKGFVYDGSKAGTIEKKNDTFKKKTFYDINDDFAVIGVQISNTTYYTDKATSQMLEGEGKLIFHFTNAFRKYHGLEPFKWEPLAAKAARLHCEDMAENKFFSHTSLDGRSPSERMSKQGINTYMSGENIAAGQESGTSAFVGWVNSSGHRENLLSGYKRMGVGIAILSTSIYGRYYAQNFCN